LERAVDGFTPFLREYEQLLLTFGTDYQDVRHERTTDAVNEFFDPAPFQERVFEMRQEFDYTGIEGRLLSSSLRAGDQNIRITSRCCANCGGFLTRMLLRDGQPSITNPNVFWKIAVTGEKVSDEKSFHMTPDEFRRHGHAVVDWIADYQARIESFPVLSRVKRGRFEHRFRRILRCRVSRLKRY